MHPRLKVTAPAIVAPHERSHSPWASFTLFWKGNFIFITTMVAARESEPYRGDRGRRTTRQWGTMLFFVCEEEGEVKGMTLKTWRWRWENSNSTLKNKPVATKQAQFKEILIITLWEQTFIWQLKKNQKQVTEKSSENKILQRHIWSGATKFTLFVSPKSAEKKVQISPPTTMYHPVCHTVDLAHWIWYTWMLGASYH